MALLMTIFPEVETISYHVGNELRHVQLADVLVAQADDKYTRITLKSGADVLVDISLKALMDKFPTHFVQIHRSTLVNRNDIAVLESQGHKHFVGLKSFICTIRSEPKSLFPTKSTTVINRSSAK